MLPSGGKGISSCMTEHEVLLYYAKNAVYRCLVSLLGNCTPLVDSLQQTDDASKFPTVVEKFTQQPSALYHFDS